MNRQAFRTALGRTTPSTTARALSLPVSATTPTTFASFFSTTGPRPADNDNNNNNNNSSSSSNPTIKPRQTAAVSRLSQLNNSSGSNNNSNSNGGRQVLSSIPGIPSSPPPFRNNTNGGNGAGRRGVDARSLRVSPDGGPSSSSGSGPRVLNPEEQAVIDRLEKGEVVPFDPQLTMNSLTGYGAAVATDASVGQVETVLRTMRLMTGGMAFNSESGVTADVKEVMKRYRAKKPIFVHSKGEKAWIESAQPRLKLVGPDAGTKKAIIEPAVLGKYEAAGFAEVGDTAGTMANYHSRTFTYMGADSQKFMDKVLSLLPAQQGGKPASQAKP
ncbi:hypothetical protein CHGG_01061 [Chaetomium globosum CBS 148.51]|uniref:Uncharacterized protein n=1 Tax=Chaetomium globosum (strain ATCC 6205 / CBS 148.51 / DSM 1962 / NBRC 6347 / NRRL 1970) TaxID=306901 RepID=Q2HFE3_CHAGB|nr:uncharacterized protein CHGG_01061 [Chaetomium globosum CBS 148.51]EAQ92826.1 hypothetical protein CHGG_01061 [Chaetomium globosum CBS 148.51]